MVIYIYGNGNGSGSGGGGGGGWCWWWWCNQACFTKFGLGRIAESGSAFPPLHPETRVKDLIAMMQWRILTMTSSFRATSPPFSDALLQAGVQGCKDWFATS